MGSVPSPIKNNTFFAFLFFAGSRTSQFATVIPPPFLYFKIA